MKTSDLMLKQGNWLFRHRSYLPLFIVVFAFICMWFQKGRYGTDVIWFDLLCLLISALGEIIRIIAVGHAAERTSGRNTKVQVADEINQTGIYSIIRHPLYVGNFIIWLGLAIFTQIWWLVLIFILIYWLYYERIILAEEDFLTGKFGTAYEEYSSKVNSILPCVQNFVPSRYRFNPKRVLRQEYSSVYGIVAVFFSMVLFKNIVSGLSIIPQAHWLVIGITFTVIYLTLRTLKKTTRVLHNDSSRQSSDPEE